MRRIVGALMLWLVTPAVTHRSYAEAAPPVPFKLGTFERQGRPFVGLVRADQGVVDVAAAHVELETSNPAWPTLKPPADMRDLISR
jgi:hypothetical protein